MSVLEKLFAPPLAKDLLTEQLADAQRDFVMHKLAVEEHAAWVEMLEKRIIRIQDDLNTFTFTKENQE